MAYLTAAPTPTPGQLAEIAELERASSEALRMKEESWERSDTDGFLTQWAHGITAELNNERIAILKNGGYAQFLVLCDAAGAVICEKPFTFADRYAPGWTGATVQRWKLPDAMVETAGRRWVPLAGGGKSRVQKKLGLHEETRWFPAFAKITTGNAKSTGLAGCANAYVATFRKES